MRESEASPIALALSQQLRTISISSFAISSPSPSLHDRHFLQDCSTSSIAAPCADVVALVRHLAATGAAGATAAVGGAGVGAGAGVDVTGSNNAAVIGGNSSSISSSAQQLQGRLLRGVGVDLDAPPHSPLTLSAQASAHSPPHAMPLPCEPAAPTADDASLNAGSAGAYRGLLRDCLSALEAAANGAWEGWMEGGVLFAHAVLRAGIAVGGGAALEHTVFL